VPAHARADAPADVSTDAAAGVPADVLAILGPTASGKSALGMEVAGQIPVEVVACDSLQVYSGMDIGTGKPTPADRAAVPHHLVDVALPTESFHAARWAALADAAIAGIAARGRTPLVIGGTGLYLRALAGGLFEAPPPDPVIRQRHRDEAARVGVEALHARLAAIDPTAAAQIQPRDLVRVSRALEVHEQTGVPISELYRRGASAPSAPRPRIRALVLDPPQSELRARIGARVDQMMAAGFLEETRRLRAAYGAGARPLHAALGYRQLGEHLDGRLTLDEAVAATKAATVGYARRQRTWFRKHPPGAWRVASAPAVADVVRWWQAGPEDAAAAAITGARGEAAR